MVSVFFEQSNAAAWFFLIIIPPAYYFLYIYIEAITPDTYGVTQPCCYCFQKRQ
jgi:hypothetical protein